MDSIYEIQVFEEVDVKYPTYQTRSYCRGYAKSLKQAEERIQSYLDSLDKRKKERILIFSVEEFPCCELEDFPFSRNCRIFDSTGKLVDGENYEGEDVKIKDERFEVGEIVEAIEGNEVHLGVLVTRRGDGYHRHVVVGVDHVYYVNYTIIAPRGEISENLYNKLQKKVDAFIESFYEKEKENEAKDKFMSHCHCYKEEASCPEFDNSIDEIVWRAEKAIASYPKKLLAKSTQLWHDREIVKYICMYIRDTNVAKEFIKQMAPNDEKCELNKIIG